MRYGEFNFENVSQASYQQTRECVVICPQVSFEPVREERFLPEYAKYAHAKRPFIPFLY